MSKFLKVSAVAGTIAALSMGDVASASTAFTSSINLIGGADYSTSGDLSITPETVPITNLLLSGFTPTGEIDVGFIAGNTFSATGGVFVNDLTLDLPDPTAELDFSVVLDVTAAITISDDVEVDPIDFAFTETFELGMTSLNDILDDDIQGLLPAPLITLLGGPFDTAEELTAAGIVLLESLPLELFDPELGFFVQGDFDLGEFGGGPGVIGGVIPDPVVFLEGFLGLDIPQETIAGANIIFDVTAELVAVDPTAVPAPGMVGLFGIGLAGLGLVRKRKQA
ncbi:MAG: PEP-CTERM sorting domain-containing protein [Pseudomonadota bacterium]